MGAYTSLFLSYAYDSEKETYDFNLYGVDNSILPPLIKALKDELQRRMESVSFKQELAQSGAVPVIQDNQLILKFQNDDDSYNQYFVNPSSK